MATPKISDAVLQQTVDTFAKAGDVFKAAEILGVSRRTIYDRAKLAEERGIKPGGGASLPNDVQGLKATVKRLEAELRRANSVSSEIETVKGVIGEYSRRVSELNPPSFIINPVNKPSAPGVPTLMLSDWHGGERVFPSQINGVNGYNVDIMRDRAQMLVESTVHLLKIISPKLEYPGIVLPLGGDMISGNIHEELTATNELNSMPAVIEMYTLLAGIIEVFADTIGNVFLPCVTGNHGRDTRKMWGKDRHHTSFDWLLYQFLARKFADDKRITFFIPDGPDAFYRIYDHAYLLTHGDQFRGGDGMIGCLGPILRGDHKKRSRNAQVDMDYDTMIMGHWHQYIHHNRVIVNGSLKGYDEYAYANNFGFEVPQQALWITHPKYGQTFRMPVYVERHSAPVKTAWASVPK